MPIRKLPRNRPLSDWGGQPVQSPGQRAEGCPDHPPSGQNLTRAAAEIISNLHKAKEELAQELEVNLAQLHAVLEETQRIARQMKAVLSEIRGESEFQQENPERPESGGADRRRGTARSPSRGQDSTGLRQRNKQTGRGARAGARQAPAQSRTGADVEEQNLTDALAADPASEGWAPPCPEDPPAETSRQEAEPPEPWDPPIVSTWQDEWEPPVPWEAPESEDPWEDEDEW